MINSADLIKIGFLSKPHGTRGELTLALSQDIDLENVKYLFLEEDGTYIPYFIESQRDKGEDILVKLEDIDNIEQAKALQGFQCYMHNKDCQELTDDGSFMLDDLIGFQAYEVGKEHEIGTIIDYDNISLQPKFILSTSRGEVLIPIVDDFIQNIDPEKKIIEFSLPQGLLTINDNEGI